MNTTAQFFCLENQNTSEDMRKFVEYYSKGYNNQFGKCKLEKRIENLLECDKKLNQEEVEDILCWKTGQACIKLCKIDLGEVCNIATKEERGATEKPFLSDEEQKRYLELLKRLNDVKGIGIVYALSILYFISNGNYPIYDRFAQTAITALKKGSMPGERIPYSQLDTNAVKAFKGAYLQYCKDVEGIFHEDYTRREVDKALWIYGHLFNKEESRWRQYLKTIFKNEDCS